MEAKFTMRCHGARSTVARAPLKRIGCIRGYIRTTLGKFIINIATYMSASTWGITTGLESRVEVEVGVGVGV
jgi:hypothetical protein